MSILAAIIPGFGFVYKWYEKSVKSHHYAKFISELSYICPTKICNQSIQIVMIYDNCPIHKTIDVIFEAHKNKINLFSIIPYSPQLNLLIKNCFSQLKFYALFEFTALPKELINKNTINQHTLPAFINQIMKQWGDMSKKHYDSTSTANVYGAWINILEMCMNVLGTQEGTL